MRKVGKSLAIITAAVLLSASPAEANSFSTPGGIVYRVKTKTLMDMRFRNIMRQKFDFSCGSAALASLLTYHYQRPVTEREVIEAMYAGGDKEKIRKEGFSLLDMKNYLQSLGLRANGYREPLDRLAQVGIPAIVLINRKGYMHFVVVQGLTEDKVLIGDPAQGRKVVDRKKFEQWWDNKILFVLDDEVKTARNTFNTVYAWNTRSTSNFTVPLPNSNLAAMTLFSSYNPNIFNN